MMLFGYSEIIGSKIFKGNNHLYISIKVLKVELSYIIGVSLRSKGEKVYDNCVFYFDLVAMYVITQHPIIIHILFIAAAPVYITQRNATHCGVATINIDIMNPVNVNGAHIIGYTLAAT